MSARENAFPVSVLQFFVQVGEYGFSHWELHWYVELYGRFAAFMGARRGQVVLARPALAGIETSQRPGGRKRFEFLAGHGRSTLHSSARMADSFSMPSLTLVFTVPRASPVFLAISLCDKPSK